MPGPAQPPSACLDHAPAKAGDVPSEALESALDRLYAAPFDRFVEVRRALAAELKAAGDVAASRAVASASKPSRTAWALNQLARRDRERIEEVLASRDAAAEAQKEGDADRVRSTAREFRSRIAEVARQAKAILEESGSSLSPVQARRLGETVQTLAGGDEQSRSRLLGGRLVEDMESEDPFAGVVVPAKPARPPAQQPAAQPQAEAARQRAREEKEKLEKARAVEAARGRVDELDLEAREARRRAREAETAAARMQADAERARRAVAEVEDRLSRAKEDLRRLQG